MGETKTGVPVQEGLELGTVNAIAKTVSRSSSAGTAFRRLADFVSRQGFELLQVSLVEGTGPVRETVWFESRLRPIRKARKKAGFKAGCPLLARACEDQAPFEALGGTYPVPMKKELAVRRYLKLLSGIGHLEVGVIPVRTRGRLVIIFVGLGSRLFRGSSRDLLISMMGQFMSAFSVKYTPGNVKTVTGPADRASDKSIVLSETETSCLLWIAQGFSIYEIGEKLGLSEHTVLLHLDVICQKLDAKNITHAVVLAIGHDLIDLQDE